MRRRTWVTIGLAVVLTSLVAVPALAAIKYQFGYLWIKGGQASGTVTFYTEDETYASVSVQDQCPGDGHYLSAWVQIRKNGDDQEMAYATTRGHKCGYGTSNQEFVEAFYFDHQAARLVVCRYPTGSYTASSCQYGRWIDNPYDD